MGNIQRYTPVTWYPKTPLYNIIIIVDMVLRQKRKFQTRKVMKSTISPYCHFGMHDQGLPAAMLTCAAYIDGKKIKNSSFWKYRIIVASKCRRSVEFGCCVTWTRMGNRFYVIAKMQHLYKFTISHRWNGAWKTSRFACAHTGSRYWLVESTLFAEHVSLRLHWQFRLKFSSFN